jgi:hypothetical protein
MLNLQLLFQFWHLLQNKIMQTGKTFRTDNNNSGQQLEFGSWQLVLSRLKQLTEITILGDNDFYSQEDQVIIEF